MLSGLSKTILVLSSFSPLLVVFGLLDYWGPGWPTLTCYVLAGLGWIGLGLLRRQSLLIAPTPLKVVKADRKDQEILTYLAANLLPFLSVHPSDGKEVAASLIFIGLIVLFSIRGELYYTNPALAVLDYRILAVQTQTHLVYIITKKTFIPSGTEIRAVPLANHVMWE